jgi:hypothetical protein
MDVITSASSSRYISLVIFHHRPPPLVSLIVTLSFTMFFFAGDNVDHAYMLTPPVHSIDSCWIPMYDPDVRTITVLSLQFLPSVKRKIRNAKHDT